MKLLSLVLLCTVLVGCSSTRGIDKVQSLGESNKVVVLSLFGDTMTVRSRDGFILDDTKRTIPLSDWHVDVRLESLASDLIEGSGRFRIATRANEDARQRFGRADLSSWTAEPEVKGGHAALASYARSVGANSILLVAPTGVGGDIFLGGGGVTLHTRYGIYHAERWLSSDVIRYYVTLQLVLVDAATGTEIASTSEWDSAIAGEGDWIPGQTTLTPDQQARVRNGLWDVFDKVLRAALAEITLI